MVDGGSMKEWSLKSQMCCVTVAGHNMMWLIPVVVVACGKIPRFALTPPKKKKTFSPSLTTQKTQRTALLYFVTPNATKKQKGSF